MLHGVAVICKFLKHQLPPVLHAQVWMGWIYMIQITGTWHKFLTNSIIYILLVKKMCQVPVIQIMINLYFISIKFSKTQPTNLTKLLYWPEYFKVLIIMYYQITSKVKYLLNKVGYKLNCILFLVVFKVSPYGSSSSFLQSH